MPSIGSMQPDFVHTFVVYDSASGTVAHIRQIVGLHGCHSRSLKDMEAEALEYARSSIPGRKVSDQLEVLGADGKLEAGALYRVNCKTKELIRDEKGA